jgi:hypothetical protein
MYILLSPFYFFRSGIPQIADFVGVVFIVVLLIKNNFKLYILEKRNSLNFLFLFVGWAFVATLFWVIIINDTSMMIFPIYYLYNWLFIYFLYILYIKNINILYIIFKAISLSLIIQFLLSFLVIDPSAFRQIIFFNNPNQLGYFAVTNTTIFLFLSEYFKMNKILFTLTLLSGIYLTFLSLSNAAMIALFLLLIIHFFKFFKKSLKYLFLFLVIILILVPFIPKDTLISPIINNAYLRITSIPEESDASFARRGYDRIVKHPEFWFFGAGEGSFHRFEPVSGHELHSSWGTIFFSYGLVGTLLFLLFFLNVFEYKKNFFYFLPGFFYGLAHQGLRSTEFWILLFIFYVSYEMKISRSHEKNSGYLTECEKSSLNSLNRY